MKTITYKILILTFLIVSMTISLKGQQMPDSLIKYLEIASKNSPVVLQRFYEYQAALQKVPQAGGLSDPELSVGAFLKPMELVNGNQVVDFRLMQMFPWFGVIKSAKDEMSLMANAKLELFRDAKLQVFYDIQRTWYELFKIQKGISISEKNIEILKTIERLATVKFQAASSSGTSPGLTSAQPAQTMPSGFMGSSQDMSGLADLYRIQMESSEIQNDIALLKNQYSTTVALFNSYLNRPPATPVFIPDKFSPDTITIPLNSVPDSIMERNPMLSMLELEKQSIQARKKMIKNMGYPMVGLGLNYSLISKNEMSESSMNGKDMLMPMLSVTLPVYRKKYNARAKEAELLITAASINYTAAANSLQTEYYQAIQLYQDAQRRVRLYDNQSKLASKSLDLMIKGFAASASSLTDLLRIQQQTLDYELKQTEAIADLNTASAFLNRLMASSRVY